MAQPIRKLPELKSPVPKGPESVNDNESPEEFKEELANELKTNRALEAHRWDILAMYSIRMHFPELKHKTPESMHFYVIHPEYNVAIARAFRLKDSKNILSLTETRAEASEFESKSGIPSEKGIAERHRIDEKADVVVVLDEDVRATKNFRKNIAQGGWVICRVGLANSLRNKYEFMGFIEKRSGDPHVQEGSEKYWEKTEVKSEAEYDSAEAIEGMATRAEMEEALTTVGRKWSGDLVEAYRELLADARAEGRHSPDGKLVYTYTEDNVTKTYRLNPILPSNVQGNEDDIVIMKKRRGALV